MYISLHMAIVYEKEYVQGVSYADGSSLKEEVYDYDEFGKAIKSSKREEVPALNIVRLVKITFTTLKDYPRKNGFITEDKGITVRFVFGTAFVGLIIMLAYSTTRKKYIAGKENGTAEWGATKDLDHLLAKNILKGEIKNIQKNRKLRKESKLKQITELKERLTEDSNMLLTQTEKICIYNYELNNNTLIIGGSGSGKTRGYVLPNILQANSSFVITDPKGEILAKTGRYLEEERGYRVRAINLFEMDQSSCYNPFAYIHVDRGSYEEDVITLIDTIIINTNGGVKNSGSDKFWDNAEKLFLSAIFFAVSTAFVKEEQTMATVMLLISWLEIEEEQDLKNSELDIFFQMFAEKYGNDHFASRSYKEFRSKSAGKTAKSIVITAVSRLQTFNTKNLKKITSRDDMHFERIGEEKTAIFVIMPPTNDTYNFIAGMVFTQIFQELNYCALSVHKEDGQRLPIPVRFILDEFANTCTIPNFVKILSYARSLNIGIAPILQSLNQIKSMYKDDWQTIVDNCNSVVYLGGVRNMETLEEISKWLGEGTFDEKDYSQSKGGHGSSTVSYKKIGRKLLDPAEIQKLKKTRCLLFVSGYNPFHSAKIDYKKHRYYKYTSDFNRRFTFIYNPDKVLNESYGITGLPVAEQYQDNSDDRIPFTHGEYENSILKVNQAIKEQIPEAEFDLEKALTRLQAKYLGMTEVEDVTAIDDGDAYEQRKDYIL